MPASFLGDAMNIQIDLAGVVLDITSERPLEIGERLKPFLCEGRQGDVYITFTWDWDRVPKPTGQPMGTDLLQNYYYQGGRYFCATRGGPKGWVSCADYLPDLREVRCAINEKPFLQLPHSLGLLMRYLPMRQILSRFRVLFFHGALIGTGGGGILFTAPSGTGKTTQARLWRDLRGAELLCNDRTLLRRQEGIWMGFGYPVDGSDPVSGGACTPLTAVVLLGQAPDNRITRLPPAKALASLMSQMVLDTWSGEERETAIGELLRLYETVPIYRLECTPDERAILTLEEQMKKDGVIP